MSQNRYTYAENNPVNFADPSGHRKTSTKGPVLQAGEAAAGRRGGTMSFAESARIANGGTKRNTSPVVNNPAAGAAAMYQNRRDTLGLPPQNMLLDNARIYNGQDYYNNLLLRTPITTLMSTSGGSFTYVESVAAKVEAARCMGYEYVVNGEQEAISKNDIKVTNGDKIFYIPSTFIEIVVDKDKGIITEYILHPADDWASLEKKG